MVIEINDKRRFLIIWKQIQFEMQSDKKKFQDIRRILEQRGYQTIKQIGKGAFGEVLLVRSKTQKGEKLHAVKIIGKNQVKKKPFLQKYIDQEIEIMKKLNHQNIVRQQCSFDTADFIVIVMEYCQQGNLLTFQSRLPGKVFPLDHALQVLVEVMKGLKCIHQKNFIHRDIKSENVLLKKNPNTDGTSQIQYKIADFGFARSIGGVLAKTHCGTEKYMAPEILNNSYYGISVDIWALGVLFYFMLFAEYPFRGHDMKAEISRKCSPSFSLQAAVSKKQKLKNMSENLQDFFKKIFVIDSKKRMNFSSIVRHPLLQKYEKQFQQNVIFYAKLEKDEEYVKDDVEKITQEPFESSMEAQDQSRSGLLKKKIILSNEKHLEKELEQINFEVSKFIYLKQCAIQLFDNYTNFLTYAERLGAKFYLLKAFRFYVEPLTKDLQMKKMPQQLAQIDISSQKWSECTKTQYYGNLVNKLQEETLQSQLTYDDTYNLLEEIIGKMPIKNFEKGYTPNIIQKKFDELKFSYRSTTSYIFKAIHENKKIQSHLRNKIKIRLFCCHMINRIFNRKQIGEHFPYFFQWLKTNKITYKHTFDFIYFKKWILEENQQNLEKNISLLHKTFF